MVISDQTSEGRQQSNLKLVSRRPLLFSPSSLKPVSRGPLLREARATGETATRSTRRPYRSSLTPTSLFQRTPEANSRASSPCSEFEQFQIVPVVETPYLARAGKNEFLNLVPDIEEIRPG